MAEASERAAAVVAELRSLGSAEGRAGQARFGIKVDRAFGVPMAKLRPLARRLKRDQELSLALWATGHHEARILAGLIGEPGKVTAAQMDSWVAEFDSWDLCDQVCFIFEATPHARKKIFQWAKDEREFVRRAAFALLAERAVHAKTAPDASFLEYLPLIEQWSTDPRNYVRKAVNWALRQIGKRSLDLHGPALALAQKLAASDDKTARWIGKDAARELTDPAQLERVRRKAK